MTKIMLVEDDNNLREIYGARLSAEGYEIVFAQDGEEALALAVKEKPELIVSDVMMPKISGFDMLDILRNAPETQNTKVIMMTALSQAEDQERANKLGADKYLVKSQVTLEDVVKTVKEVLGDQEDPANTSSTETTDDTPALSPVATEEEPTPTTSETSEEQPEIATNPQPEPVASSIPVTEAPEIVPATPPTPEVTESTSSADTSANPSEEIASTPEPEIVTPSESPTPESIVPETPPTPSEPVQSPTSTTPPVADDQQATNSTDATIPSADNATTDQPASPIQVNLPDDTATAEDTAGSLPGVSSPSVQAPTDDNSPTSSDDSQSSTSEPDEPVVAKPELPGQNNESETPTTPAIGPSLNEALEDVEKELEKEIKSTGSDATITSTAPTVANGGELSSVITPTTESAPAPKEEESTKPDETKKEDPYAVPDPVVISPTQAPPSFQPETVPPPPTNTGGIIEDQDGRKTINPINDLNSKPDLNELLAKEQAKAGLENPPANSVISPEGKVEQPPTTPSVPVTPAPAPDPNSSISL